MEQQFLTQWPLIGQLSGRWMLCGFMLMQTMLNSLHAATMTGKVNTVSIIFNVFILNSMTFRSGVF